MFGFWSAVDRDGRLDEASLTPTKTLAEMAASHGFSAAKLVKIDTDGFDGRIIQASRDWLSHAQPALFWPDPESGIKMTIQSLFSGSTAAARLLVRNQYTAHARIEIRNAAFRSTCKIKAVPLAEIIGKNVALVQVPGTAIDTAAVGSADYYYALGALVRHQSPKVIVEIGTFVGVGTLTLAMNMPRTRE